MYTTQEGLEKLQSELKKLKEKRKEISKRIQSAKELGDLSENAEYSEAKDAQRINETKVAELEEQIRSAEVVSGEGIKGQIRIGSTIKVKSDKVKSEKGTQSFKIVGTNESDPEQGWISNESPLGAAFINKKKGDKIEVQLPNKTACYKILEVKE